MPDIRTPNLGLLKVRASGLQSQAIKIQDDNMDALDASVANMAGDPGPRSSGYLGWTFDPLMMTSASFGQAGATIYLTKIMVPANITASTLWVHCAVAGNSYSNAQLGLYSSAGVFLGATAVMASGGTNTFGSTGTKNIALSSPAVIAGGPTSFVWGAVHLGVNNVTAVVLQTAAVGIDGFNGPLAVGASRAGFVTGHATNPLATIGNFSPASVGTGSPTPRAVWMAIS